MPWALGPDAGAEHAAPVGDGDELGAAADAQFDHGAPDMGLRRGLGDDETVGDLLVRQAGTHQGQHLAFAFGEAVQEGHVGDAGAAQTRVDQGPGQARGDQGPAACDQPQRARQFAGVGVLAQQAARPRPERLQSELRQGAVGEDNGADAGPGGEPAASVPRRSRPAAAGPSAARRAVAVRPWRGPGRRRRTRPRPRGRAPHRAGRQERPGLAGSGGPGGPRWPCWGSRGTAPGEARGDNYRLWAPRRGYGAPAQPRFRA